MCERAVVGEQLETPVHRRQPLNCEPAAKLALHAELFRGARSGCGQIERGTRRAMIEQHVPLAAAAGRLQPHGTSIERHAVALAQACAQHR